MSVWAVVVPGVLLSRKLDHLYLSYKTHWLLCGGNVELHIELGCVLGMFVNCKKRPLFVWSSHCIDGDGRR